MPKRGIIKVATCQFPVGASITRNASWISAQMVEARRRGADVVHFSECALSGYAGTDLKSWDGYDWGKLWMAAEGILYLARKLRIWVVLGSSHPLRGAHLPHNSLYLIDPRGNLVDRYDKRFCTAGDLKYYSPGDHFVVFDINGVRCGLLICFDARFPEVFRAYKQRGVQVMFHSFYIARAKGRTIHTTIIRPTLQSHAATNYMWVSGNNCSAYYQTWPSVFIQPDGEIVSSLTFHRAGVMVNEVNTHKKFYDASGEFRDSAMKGVLHSGKLVSDPRSRDRKSL